jgi:hypothetical protein
LNDGGANQNDSASLVCHKWHSTGNISFNVPATIFYFQILQSLKQTAAIPHGQFRYSVDNPLLTPQQREFYEINGYIVIPKVIEPQLLQDCSCVEKCNFCFGAN